MSILNYALFHIKPDSDPPFDIEIGVDNKKEIITNCENIPDAIKKIKKFCKQNNFKFSKNFTLLYPIYLEYKDTSYENRMHAIAWIIKENSEKNRWQFNRIGGYTGLKAEDFIK